MLKFIEYLNDDSYRIAALVVFIFYFDVILYIFSFACFHVKYVYCIFLHYISLCHKIIQLGLFCYLSFYSDVSFEMLKSMEQNICLI